MFIVDFAEIVTEPVFLAVTLPFLLTVAIFLLEVDQVTLFEALLGFTDLTFNVKVSPTARFFLESLNVILVGFLFSFLLLPLAYYPNHSW